MLLTLNNVCGVGVEGVSTFIMSERCTAYYFKYYLLHHHWGPPAMYVYSLIVCMYVCIFLKHLRTRLGSRSSNDPPSKIGIVAISDKYIFLITFIRRLIYRSDGL